MEGHWWCEGNDLALVDAIRKATGKDSDAQARYFSHLIGAARVAGLTDQEIEQAWISPRCLTIYEP